MNNLTLDQIKHIATLAKLEFSDSDLEKFALEFNSILGYISQVEECDVSEIEFEHNMDDYKGEVLKEDLPKNFTNIKKLLSNADDRIKGGYIKTSQIIKK